MTSRRDFLSALAGAGAALPAFRTDAFALLGRAETIAGGRAPSAVADDELYWSQIQRAFDADRTMVNLNNGGV
ncbi:MAG: twin-arginine translocation signal domain-containing protein, partial [Gemmatimonadales bacterium]|nr:twin-arginine translocation signal domain-containing protein [Gemmatimonadales bacterium]